MNQNNNVTNAATPRFQRSDTLNMHSNGDSKQIVVGYCEKKCLTCDVSTKKVRHN